MGIFSTLFGKSKNPANAAMPYLNQIPGVAREQFNPFIQRGQRSGDILQNQYDKFANEPTDYLDQIMSKYRPSSGYDFKQKELLKAAGNTAAAGGFRGTEADQQNSAQLVQNLLGDDMQQFLANVLGIQNQGIQGHQGFQNQGYDAASSLADVLTNNLANQGGLAFQGQAQTNQNNKGRAQQLWNLLGGAASGFGAAANAGSNGQLDNYMPSSNSSSPNSFNGIPLRSAPRSSWIR